MEQTCEQEAPWRSRRDYKPGQSIALLVEDGNPYSFKEKKAGAVWGLTILLSFLGVGCTLVGVTIAWTAFRKEMKRIANQRRETSSQSSQFQA